MIRVEYKEESDLISVWFYLSDGTNRTLVLPLNDEGRRVGKWIVETLNGTPNAGRKK